jgi:type I restriction enzyme S subunit
MKSQGSKQLPDEWSWIKLSDISKIFDCKHYTPNYVPKGIPLIRTNDTVPGFFSFGNTVYVSREDYEKLTDVNKPRRTDIVFAREGSFGVASYINDDREYAIGQRTMIIRADQSKIDPIYLTTYINSPPCQEELLKVSMGTTVKRVNVADVKELPIAVPPLAEQKRIAAIAQKADRLRRIRRYALQLSDTYLQSVFLEMFGNPVTNPKRWKTVKLEDVCREITVGFVGSMTQEYVEKGIPFLRSQNVLKFILDLSSIKYITPEFHKKLKKSALYPGDVVVVRTGNAGSACIIPQSLSIANCSDLVIIRPAADINGHYLTCLFNSAWGQGNVTGNLVGQIQQHFNIGAAREMLVHLPPLPLQEKFAQIVQKYERLRTQQREADRQAEHLFQTLLHRAFQGEL